MSIGQTIKEYRKRRGLTQRALAKKIELSRSYLGDVESDRYNPSVKTLKKIAEVLQIPTDKMFGQDDLPGDDPRDLLELIKYEQYTLNGRLASDSDRIALEHIVRVLYWDAKEKNSQ